jgi:hypothetical protein
VVPFQPSSSPSSNSKALGKKTIMFMFYSFKKNLIITNIVTFVFAIVIIMIIVTIVVATKGMFVFIFVVTIVTFILYFEKKWRESMTKRKKQRL